MNRFLLTAALVLVVGLADGKLTEWVLDANVRLTTQEVERFSNDKRLGCINRNFRVTLVTTPSSNVWPHSASPLFFSVNPYSNTDQQSTRGLSIGHSLSTKQLEVRISDGDHNNNLRTFGGVDSQGQYGAGSVFKYLNTVRVNQKNTVELTCVFVAGKSRICSVKHNGHQATPHSVQIRATGDIYGNDGGTFGNVWGWRFKGTLNSIVVAEPEAACIFYGDKAVKDVKQLAFNSNSVLKFDCPTTTSTITTATTTTSTTTTNTVLEALSGKMTDVEVLIEGQVQQQQNKTAELERKLQAVEKRSEDKIAALEKRVGELTAAIAKLGAPFGNSGAGVTPSPKADVSRCSKVVDSNERPEIVADGDSLAITACSGSVKFHAEDCMVDPCQLQQEMRHIQAKLKPLGDL